MTGDERRDRPGAEALDPATESYLYDPGATPVDEVVALERALAPLRHRPRPLPALRPRRRMPRLRWLAAAALLLALGAAAGAWWIWTWPAGRAWPVLAGPVDLLPVGADVRVARDESLLVRVARIGWMRVEGGSDLTLTATASNRHRLEVREGSLRVGVWAPPGSLTVRTPAGRVVDLGCEFRLSATGAATTVAVTSGWVMLENAWGESLVPAGASGRMARGRVPSVPVFRDADPRFREAVKALEAGSAEAAASVVATARSRDTATLLMLAVREPEARGSLVARAAELSPPSSRDLVAGARRGDRQAIWAWIDELPLPPPKSWATNWRDRARTGRGRS